MIDPSDATMITAMRSTKPGKHEWRSVWVATFLPCLVGVCVAADLRGGFGGIGGIGDGGGIGRGFGGVGGSGLGRGGIGFGLIGSGSGAIRP